MTEFLWVGPVDRGDVRFESSAQGLEKSAAALEQRDREVTEHSGDRQPAARRRLVDFARQDVPPTDSAQLVGQAKARIAPDVGADWAAVSLWQQGCYQPRRHNERARILTPSREAKRMPSARARGLDWQVGATGEQVGVV
ncbi:MAG TPA: hypothetical protein VKD90_22620, partial [Gemmataceae bacterium]|nr:hypothetical protein [Gemmataceae bacterium]